MSHRCFGAEPTVVRCNSSVLFRSSVVRCAHISAHPAAASHRRVLTPRQAVASKRQDRFSVGRSSPRRRNVLRCLVTAASCCCRTHGRVGRLALRLLVCRHIVHSHNSEHNMAGDEDKAEPGEGDDQPQLGIAEQLRAQTELAREEEFKRTPAPPGKTKQLLVVMRHGERIDEVDKEWSALSKRPYDPFLSDHGEDQAKKVAAKLKKFGIKKVFISPFYRCLQTASFAAEGLGVQPQDWTVTCAVGEFMNPKMMVKKGGKCPEGHINSWFFEGNGLKDHVSKKLPKAIASKLQFGQSDFKRYPENLLNSRRRYNRAFQAIADEAEGENVLIVTHGDGVNASVTRIWPWAIAHPVLHTGFTVAMREREDDGMWGHWKMMSKRGESGVWWRAELQPAYHAFKGAQGVVGGLFNKLKR